MIAFFFRTEASALLTKPGRMGLVDMDQPSKKHQLLEAIRILSSIVQFSEKKVDLSGESGKEIIKEAKAACKLLESEIERLYPAK
jgi:hypothetical protein